MKDTALYETLLGLQAPWSVKTVDLSLEEQRVVVAVEIKRGQVWTDPTDNTKLAYINGWSERQWKHLDTCQLETIIKARVPQLKYSNSQVEELAVPWAACYEIDVDGQALLSGIEGNTLDVPRIDNVQSGFKDLVLH